MMTYEEMKNRHQEEYDTFAKDKIFYIFTSSKEEFEKKLKEYGLNEEAEKTSFMLFVVGLSDELMQN